MAEIPVEKKSSLSWLWILLALLLLALLLWWLLADDDDADMVVADDPVEMAAPAAGVLTVGETVELDGARVTRLSGDMAFYVDYQGQEVPVIFDQVPTPNDATEGRFDINEGSLVDLTGEVRSSTDGLPDNADPSFLGTSENYIFATDIEEVE